MNTTKDKYVLQSVETSLQMLDLFIEYDELSAAEVARLLDMNRSKAFRFLVTLEKSGYITKNGNYKYRLSAKVTTLGQLAQDRNELIRGCGTGADQKRSCQISNQAGHSI